MISSKISSKASLDELFCPIPVPLKRNVLRSDPNLSYLSRFNYSYDKWREAISLEMQNRWKDLNGGKSPKIITNEGAHRKITRQVKEKYFAMHREQRAQILLWLLSDRTLEFLRNKGVVPTPTLEELDQAMYRFVQKLNVEAFPEIEETLPTLSPNEYFELSRPKLVATYGYPFYSTIAEEPKIDGLYHHDQKPTPENIVGINSDFWSAFLGGDPRLGHDCVFYVPESRFYFFDPVAGCYLPTSEDKVRLMLSQAIQGRAWGQPTALANTILNDFRSKKVFDEIIFKSKAILAAEAGFFQGPHARPRWGGVPIACDVQVAVESFVKEHVEQAEGVIMTLGDCLLQLGKTPAGSAGKKELTLEVNDAIRSTFNRGLRNDLRLADNRVVSGWKGLRLRVAEALEDKSSLIRESGQSFDSGTSEDEAAEHPKNLALMS